MKAGSSQSSELNPPDNITPSVGTTMTGLMVLVPIFLLFLGLFTNFLHV